MTDTKYKILFALNDDHPTTKQLVHEGGSRYSTKQLYDSHADAAAHAGDLLRGYRSIHPGVRFLKVAKVTAPKLAPLAEEPKEEPEEKKSFWRRWIGG